MRIFNLLALCLICFMTIAGEDPKPDPKPQETPAVGDVVIISGEHATGTLILPGGTETPSWIVATEELAKARLATCKNDPAMKGRECAHRVMVTYIKLDNPTLHEVIMSQEPGFGTAIAVDAHKLITCFHVVDGATRIRIQIDDDVAGPHWADATVERTDEDFDIALIVTTEDLKFAAVDERNKTQPGEIATHWGAPEGGPIVAIQGAVCVNMKCQEFYRLFDAKVKPGCSGGPLISDDGKIVGMMCDMRNNDSAGVFLPARRIRQFLKEK